MAGPPVVPIWKFVGAYDNAIGAKFVGVNSCPSTKRRELNSMTLLNEFRRMSQK
jgi:hypothetical protein